MYIGFIYIESNGDCNYPLAEIRHFRLQAGEFFAIRTCICRLNLYELLILKIR